MNSHREALQIESSIDPFERALDTLDPDAPAWIELDSAYLSSGAGDADRVARICHSTSERVGSEVSRSFAVIRSALATYDDVSASSAGGGALRVRGRQYSLALLALLDALAAEPSCSPLAIAAPLGDLRAAAFLVAGETAADRPDLSLIDRAIQRVDLRLAHLCVPLQATGYLAARDALGEVFVPFLPARQTGGRQ